MGKLLDEWNAVENRVELLRCITGRHVTNVVQVVENYKYLAVFYRVSYVNYDIRIDLVLGRPVGSPRNRPRVFLQKVS